MLSKILLILGIACSLYLIVSSAMNIMVRQINKHIDEKLDHNTKA